MKLVIHLPAEQAGAVDTGAVQRAVRSHFEYRSEVAHRRLRLEFRRGRTSLAIGLAFLFACVGLREALRNVGDTAWGPILSEGLLIIGWVAMWGPIEIFLYGWWPIANLRRTMRRLAMLPVEVRKS